MQRPWGKYEVLSCKNNFLLKRITVMPQARLSLQSHAHRSEHWVVIQGSGEVTIGEDVVVCSKNTQLFIPRGVKHRVKNTSSETELVFIEVQVGDILDENDIHRYEDDYNRVA